MTAVGYALGEKASLKTAVTVKAVDEFVALSGDDAPLHTDRHYAKEHGFADVLVHGALVGAYISRFVGTTLPGHGSVLQRMDVKFRSPCYAPADLLIEGEICQVSEATGSVAVQIHVHTGGSLIASARTTHTILSQR